MTRENGKAVSVKGIRDFDKAKFSIIGNTVRLTGIRDWNDGSYQSGIFRTSDDIVLLDIVNDGQALEYKNRDGAVMRFTKTY